MKLNSSFRALRFGRRTLAGLLLCSLLQSTWAFDIPPPPPPLYQGLIFPLFPGSSAIPFSGSSASSSNKPTPRSNSNHTSSITLATEPPQVQAHARELAAQVLPAQREALAQAYSQAFEGYRQLERKLGLPENDVANALAAFIAGNYMAMHQVEVPDASFVRLAAQLRETLPRNPGFSAKSGAAKRKLYEQSAMQGMFMAVARLAFLKQPQPAAEQNYRAAARASLEAALKLPAEQIRIDAQGLQLGATTP
ncbi:DUF6683 family protein [Paucibacter sp. DJ2R-2]|uniref:DUF6683 family protein n=1 Tax=Paucibacter sp. DJ2R-2 TaxID=2893558 RepID=UPI0021E45FC5|nr:DUF6683 family protein [Paucibacter sp. DJ2R-2]MCV2422049.1 hypothetical protein [Paucibacter sp. DJ4R-1]MCV2439334.1 hypothetical protein [Paucibacter sp. DJ2R-2]